MKPTSDVSDVTLLKAAGGRLGTDRWAIGGCILLALALRAPYFGAPLGRDEGGVAFIARGWSHGHGSLYGNSWLDRPPLLVGLYRIAVVGGSSGVRLLGAITAVALVVAVARLATAVATPETGRVAALLAAVLTGSVAIGGVFSPAELLAAVPSTLSLLCLVRAHRIRAVRLIFAAGALAVTATLIKQSFLDAGAAGAVFLIATFASDPRTRRSWPLAYATGATSALGVLALWAVYARVSASSIAYALIGFRVDALHTLAGTGLPLLTRLGSLVLPVAGSGLAITLVVALVGLRQSSGDRVMQATLSTWAAAATLGVLAGGSYWPHYLIELVPVTCVAAAMALDRASVRLRLAVVTVCVAVPATVTLGAAVYTDARPPARPELAVAGWVRAHAEPGDTQYVMYARADVGYYTGLPSPYPYAWSLMVRTIPGAQHRLQRLLDSASRPTWLVMWQDDDRWGLDPTGGIDRALAAGYRLATTVQGHAILVRSDRPYDRRTAASPSRTPNAC